jgi:hypothetical protein
MSSHAALDEALYGRRRQMCCRRARWAGTQVVGIRSTV